MGKENKTLDLSVSPPAIVLMAGLQGAGKTTTVGKLARLLKNDQKKKVLVVSAGRFTALPRLNSCVCWPNRSAWTFSHPIPTKKPVEIATAAVDYAKKHFYDVLMVDTAGRLAIDEEMMNEIKALHAAVNPVETLFVIDAMLGQDAVNTAQALMKPCR